MTIKKNTYNPHSLGSSEAVSTELLFFKIPENVEEWEPCPRCKYRPRTWTFDNGRSAICGCMVSEYDRFRVYARSIMEIHKEHDGDMTFYDENELRDNWNNYVKSELGK